jgi:hypothetical protein
MGHPVNEQTTSPGDDPHANRKLTESRNQVLGTATGEQNITQRAAFVQCLHVSNPSATETTVYAVDGTIGTGNAGALIPLFVPAKSSITHVLTFEVFTALRIQGTFQASMTVTAIGR